MVRSVRQRLLNKVAGWRRSETRGRRGQETVIEVATISTWVASWGGLSQLNPITELVLLEDQGLNRLLLLRERASGTGSAGRSSNAQRVLTVRKSDPAMLDEPIQSISIQLVERPGSVVDIFELEERLKKGATIIH